MAVWHNTIAGKRKASLIPSFFLVRRALLINPARKPTQRRRKNARSRLIEECRYGVMTQTTQYKKGSVSLGVMPLSPKKPLPIILCF